MFSIKMSSTEVIVYLDYGRNLWNVKVTVVKEQFMSHTVNMSFIYSHY